MKRLFDIVGASTALVMLLPVFIIVALMVRVTVGPPIIFRHRRPGREGEPFVMYKFRTMTEERDTEGRLLSDGERLTPAGKWLRATSLDELPELVNVLRGDMSLVGPRPLHIHYLPYYDAEERLRLSVRPGMTGWAQINGRNLVPWKQRLALDVWYVRNRSFLLDLKILARTVVQVLLRRGAVPDTELVETDLSQERGAGARPDT